MRNALIALAVAVAILGTVMYLRGGQTYRVKPHTPGAATPAPGEAGAPKAPGR